MKKPSFKKPNFEKIDEAIANIKSAFQNASQTNRQIINFKRVIANWEKGLKRLLPLGGFSGGNDVKLFFDGDALFADYKKSIDAAEKSVWVEVYILESDEIGIYIRNALIEAAKRGCEVILIFDYLGSRGLSNSFLRPLKESGAKVHVFNPIWPWRKKGPLIRRDHRKVLIVDEKIGYCGGMNISREYAGKKLGSGRYVDAQIRVLGPAVKDLSNLFLDTYSETSGELRHNFETYYKHARNNIVPSERVFLQVLASNSRRNLRAIQSSMKEALERATSYCYLTTPYFMPFGPLRKAMIDAAKRGVDVRVLTAGLSDLPMAQRAGQYIYGTFLEAGVKIYELYGGTLHSKTATIDGVFGSVGSFNLDVWSERRNLEVTVSLFCVEAAEELEVEFEKNIQLSKQVTLSDWHKRPFYKRFWQWLCYQFWL